MAIVAKDNEILGDDLFGQTDLYALAAEMEAEWDAREPAPKWDVMGTRSRYKAMESFLCCLYEPYRRVCAEEGYIEVRAIGGRNPLSYWVKMADFYANTKHVCKALYQWADCVNKEGADIYVGVLPRQKQIGKAESVRFAAWLWADLDFKIGGESAVQAGIAAVGTPQVIVHSGGGLHAYWRLSKGQDFQSGDSEAFRRKLGKFQQIVLPGGDNVADLPRVLRLPGFKNIKRNAMVMLCECPPEFFYKERSHGN